MNIADRIQKIVDCRQGRGEYVGRGHIDKVREKKKFFEELLRKLEDYQGFRAMALNQIASENGAYYILSMENPVFRQNIETASPDEAIAHVKSALQELRKLEMRFERDSISISVIGRARQGKSLLLQSISGLADEIIPASNGGDCTGAKSVIVNSSGEMYAKIFFYNEIELVEQIQRYLDELGIPYKLGGLSQVPSLNTAISRFEERMETKTGREQSLFGHLRKYVEHFDEYKEYVGLVVEEHDERKIRDYVAQYDVNMLPTYYFLAVKEVQIFTEFPFADAGKIVLVDTIGLGDTSLGIRDKMIRTLRDDSDAAILVRLPNANGDGIRVEDDELYDLICEAMGKDSLGKWLFFALNVCEELGNRNSGKVMEQALLSRKLNFAFMTMVNCGDQKDVEEKLLQPVLQYLSENLAEVDNRMMENANMVFEKCYQVFFALCSKVEMLSRSTFMKSLTSGGLFDELYCDDLQLASKLEELNVRYKNHEQKCEVIEAEIRKTIRTLASFCPEREDILSKLTSGKLTAHANIVYENLADHFRASISDQFEEINRSIIVNLQEGLKQDIIGILRSADGGKLDAVPLHLDSEDTGNIEWLRAFIAEKLNDYPLVKEAFEGILNYRLNIEGMLEYKVNRCLECLDPEARDKFALLDFSEDKTKEEEADRIEQSLLSAVNLLAGDIIHEIQELLKIPYNSFYARIRKLRERIIYSEKGERELKNMYREFATYIWKDKFAAIAKKQGVMEELNGVQDSFAKNRSKQLFIIKL